MKQAKNTLTNNTSDITYEPQKDWVTNTNVQYHETGYVTDRLFEEYKNYEAWRHINEIVDLIYNDNDIPLEERVLVKKVLEDYQRRKLK